MKRLAILWLGCAAAGFLLAACAAAVVALAVDHRDAWPSAASAAGAPARAPIPPSVAPRTAPIESGHRLLGN